MLLEERKLEKSMRQLFDNRSRKESSWLNIHLRVSKKLKQFCNSIRRQKMNCSMFMALFLWVSIFFFSSHFVYTGKEMGYMKIHATETVYIYSACLHCYVCHLSSFRSYKEYTHTEFRISVKLILNLLPTTCFMMIFRRGEEKPQNFPSSL